MKLKYPHLHDVLKLPRVQRVLHPKARRHYLAALLGVFMMTFGSSIAVYHWTPLPHLLADVVAYGLHGVGLIPFIRHAEPLWLLLME